MLDLWWHSANSSWWKKVKLGTGFERKKRCDLQKTNSYSVLGLVLVCDCVQDMKQRQQFWGGVCMHWGVTRTSKSVCSMMWNRSWVTAYRWNGQSHLFFIKTLWTYWHRGAGIAQWLERRTHDWKVVSSNPCRNGRRILFSRVNFLCWLLFRYPFHPCVTAVARKRPWSFCQTCTRWQVTDKHAYTLRMWLCMMWHGAWLYGVHRTCAIKS